MKKIQLNVESLAVESFATDERATEMAGTVEAHGTRAHQNTCQVSCNNTCGDGYTCYQTRCTDPTIPDPTCNTSCEEWCLVATRDFWECVPTYGCPV